MECFVRVELAPVRRGGKKHVKQVSAVVGERIEQWRCGAFARLMRDRLGELTVRKGSEDTPPPGGRHLEELPMDVVRIIRHSVAEGALSKGARLLFEHAPVMGKEAEACMRKLHPPKPAGVTALPPLDQDWEDFTAADVREALKTFAPGATGGCQG